MHACQKSWLGIPVWNECFAFPAWIWCVTLFLFVHLTFHLGPRWVEGLLYHDSLKSISNKSKGVWSNDSLHGLGRMKNTFRMFRTARRVFLNQFLPWFFPSNFTFIIWSSHWNCHSFGNGPKKQIQSNLYQIVGFIHTLELNVVQSLFSSIPSPSLPLSIPQVFTLLQEVLLSWTETSSAGLILSRYDEPLPFPSMRKLGVDVSPMPQTTVAETGKTQ